MRANKLAETRDMLRRLRNIEQLAVLAQRSVEASDYGRIEERTAGLRQQVEQLEADLGTYLQAHGVV